MFVVDCYCVDDGGYVDVVVVVDLCGDCVDCVGVFVDYFVVVVGVCGYVFLYVDYVV